MYRNTLVLIILLVCFHPAISQIPDNFGKLTELEKNLSTYDKDPQANAVYLYERGDYYFKVIDDHIRLVKEYHVKIKILNERAFDHATVEIPLYHNKSNSEKITEIKAVTHNDGNQYNLLPSEIFTEDRSERWRIKKFTFPKVQVGSILEYAYTFVTPYDYKLDGWNFQASIPKLYSEFNAEIPGNWFYNRVLIGSLSLSTNDSKIKGNCFQVPGISKAADCEVLKYAMKDIPAFKEEKEFMLASDNYRSRLDFELSHYNRFDGTTKKYTKSWKDVDYEFKSDKDIGRQLTKKGFFERNVPESLLTEGSAFERANNIYNFVRDHFNWNGKYSSYGQARVKEAFEAKKGNAWEINMSLINLLNAADIQANLMLLSTRPNGLPKKTHPVMADFNYIIAKVKVDGKEYLLDATDKFHPFGLLPFRALNHYGRVMDFKEESYWQDIVPHDKNTTQIRAHLNLGGKGQKAEGVFDIINNGYQAVYKRKSLAKKSEEEYLDDLENNTNGDFMITEYELSEKVSNENKVAERIKFELGGIQEDKIYFNPFLVPFFESSPFKLDARDYPIDFGYPRTYRYQININIPKGYTVSQVPEGIGLNDQSAIGLKLLVDQNETQVHISYGLAIRNSYFEPESYEAIKRVFNKAVELQKNSLIVLEKVESK